MQTLPLNVISIDRGVPLKNCMFTLDLEKELFTKKVLLKDKEEDLFILSSTTQIDKKVTNDLDKISPYLPSVSLLCSVYSHSPENNKNLYEIHPIDYICIETPQMQNGQIYSTFSHIEPSNRYPDENNIEDLKNLVLFLFGTSEHYTPQAEELIEQASTVDDVCNIIITLTTTDLFDLYVYQQTTDERQKFKDCIEILMKNAPVFSLSMQDISYLSQKKEEDLKAPQDSSSKISDKKIFNMFLEEFANTVAQDSQSFSEKSSKSFSALDLPTKVKKRYIKEQKRLKRL